MSKEKNHISRIDESKNKLDNSSKAFIVFMVVAILAISIIFATNSLETSIPAPDHKQAKVQDDAIISDTNKPEENTYEVGPQAPVKHFSEDYVTEDDEELDDLNPYEAGIEIEEYNSLSQAIPKQNMLKNAAAYRVFLANADKLINKYKKNEPYSEEMGRLSRQIMPTKISKVVSDLQDYNKLISNPDLKPYKDVNLGFEFLNNLFLIKRENEEYIAVIELREKIDAELSILTDYVYSEELMNVFFNK